MSTSVDCYFFHFGLIVTGEGERQHLPKLFTALTATGLCAFRVLRLVGQRSPITSVARQIKMVGTGKVIPTKDEQEIGLPARKYLQEDFCNTLILIDDLEYDRRDQAQIIFDRYRRALDTVLTDEQQSRAAVHFLVNMLEAYYFADASAINIALDLQPPLNDANQDVETIRHPKNDLKRHYPSYNEITDSGRILEQLNIEHVLSHPARCAGLRTCFAWCANVLRQYPDSDVYQSLELERRFHLTNGKLNEITQNQ